jgi:uncharacterized protein (TIGR02145 family)
MRRTLMALSGIIILFMPEAVFAGNCGDVNNSGSINILDITYLINYVYKGGPEPDCGTPSAGICGDVNNSSRVNILDITYLISYVYLSGPEPVCGCGVIADIDGNSYKTIVIGDQCWMAENLKVTHYRNGDPLPNVTDNSSWLSLSTGAYCNYDNDEGHIGVYGRLYNWYAVDDSRNIAPEGWHAPTDTEWRILVDYLGGGMVAGGKMKDTGTVYWDSPNTGATNESGFTALPGGLRYDGGTYNGMGGSALFWSSTEWDDYTAWGLQLYYYHSVAAHIDKLEQYGFSVRCVKDNIGTGTVIIDISPDSIDAPWSLEGPGGYSSSGNGDSTLTELASGDYTVNWGAVSGWITPSDEMLSLVAGAIVTFTAVYVEEGSTGTVTDIDGNVYQTVKIGDQWWMAENLKVTHYRNGDSIPNVTDNYTWEYLTSGAYCEYNHDISNVAVYGRLYNWHAADDSRSIAPEGWHVPSDTEWKQLEMYLGMSQAEADLQGLRGTDEGGKLKEVGTTHWLSPNTGATDESGFTALPGGYRVTWGDFADLAYYACFWSSTEGGDNPAWYRRLRCDGPDILRHCNSKRFGFSVRCVKD